MFDGANYTAGKPCVQIAKRNLRATGAVKLNGGLLGTPVIDPVTNTLYLIDGYQVGTSDFHMVHAIDITSTALPDKVTPVQVSGGTFFSGNEVQRPGLLGVASTAGGPFTTIYVAFARTASGSANHRGYVFSFDASTLAQKAMYCVTCGTATANGGGIWQCGGGLASGMDSTGQNYLFFATGDGTFDLNHSGADAGDSFVKMSMDLSAVADYFTPADQACRNCPSGPERDIDFGSGGVTLIPDGLLSNFPYISVVADKEGYIWVIDRTSPGKFNGHSSATCPGKLCAGRNGNLETLQGSTNEFHNNPAYWNGNLYYAAVNDVMKMYPLANTICPAGVPPVCASQAATTAAFGYGATPSVSSNGTADGIVWAISGTGAQMTTVPGLLYAFSSDTLTELYDSNQCAIAGVAQDQPGGATSFSVPTVANGRVYIGTMGGSTGSQGAFHMYGQLSRTCDGTAGKIKLKKNVLQ